MTGVVKDLMKKDGDKDSGTITGQDRRTPPQEEQEGQRARPRRPGPSRPSEKTFKVTPETKFVKMNPVKKGAKAEAAGTFAELKDGDPVRLEVKGGKAEVVMFHAAHHHKKGKKKVAA